MNKIKEVVIEISRLYESNEIYKLDSRLSKIEIYYEKLNNDSKKNFIKNIVDCLYENKVLEITNHNLNHCKKTQFIKELLSNIEFFIETKTEKVYTKHLSILKKLSVTSKVMLIKGMAISQYYPKSYIRNQGDIDILVSSTSDIWNALELLKDDYYYEKLKLHFLHNDKFTATIDLLPYNSTNPYIDIHLTPYYMWGAVAYYDDIWNNTKLNNNFYYPNAENLILMLCAHISNQWMYRMRDINDLYCIIKNNTIDWEFIKIKAKAIGLYYILRILLSDLLDIYSLEIDHKIIQSLIPFKKLTFKERIFKRFNFGKESGIGSILLEFNFVYSNYRKYFSFFKTVKFSLKNTYYMITTHNRAFNINDKLKVKKENEVYVLKRTQKKLEEKSRIKLTSDLIICNENSKNEFFKSKYGNWYQVPYKS